MTNTPTSEDVWRYVKAETNTATEHEIGIMNAILGTSFPKESWRFKNGVHCTSCDRTLTILDYFLTGIQHHSVSKIKSFIFPDTDGKSVDLPLDPDNMVRADIVEHPNPIGCLSCGFMNEFMHDVYGHPVVVPPGPNPGPLPEPGPGPAPIPGTGPLGRPGIHVRMPKEFYNKIKGEQG